MRINTTQKTKVPINFGSTQKTLTNKSSEKKHVKQNLNRKDSQMRRDFGETSETGSILG